MMFGSFAFKNVDLNSVGNEGNNQIRPLTYWDKMMHQSRIVKFKFYKKFFEVITSEKPKEYFESFK